MIARTCPTAVVLAACPIAAWADGHSGIEAAQAAWEATLNGNDPAAVADHFTADARLLPQDGAIVDFWSGFVSGPARIELSMIDIDLLGETAVETGGYVLTLPGEDRSETVLEGKTLVIWKNDGGTRRMAQDMWNDGL